MKTVHPSYSFKRKRALQICLVLMLTLSVLQLRASAMTLFTPLQSDGLTWEMVEHDYPGAIFEDVAFLDATHGWVIGQLDYTSPTDVVVLYTDDGGSSWQVKMSEEEQYLMQIDIVDEDTIWVTGLGGPFYTTDAGETLEVTDLDSLPPTSMIEVRHTSALYRYYRRDKAMWTKIGESRNPFHVEIEAFPHAGGSVILRKVTGLFSE